MAVGPPSVAVAVGPAASVKVAVGTTAGEVAVGAGVVESGAMNRPKAVGRAGSEATGTGYPRLGLDPEKCQPVFVAET